MPETDGFLSWNIMIVGCANSGRLVDRTLKSNNAIWNFIVSAYWRRGSENDAVRMFWQMRYEGHRPNQFTLGSVLSMCAKNGLLSRGKQMHAYAVKTQFDSNDFVVDALIDMYAKCECLYEAECLCSCMPGGRNHLAWTALIGAYSRNGQGRRAIEFFQEMRAKGVKSHEYIFPSVLTACAAVSSHVLGAQVHGCVIKGGFEAYVHVKNALVGMYAKCSDLGSAGNMFDAMDVDDVVAWNAMILGYVKKGLEEKALHLFNKMHRRNMEINDLTFLSVLNSYASFNDVKDPQSVHSLIVKMGFEGHSHVSNALINMYAKQGYLSCAFKVFNYMEEKDTISWTSLITGCAHNELHEEALKVLCQMRNLGIELGPFAATSILSCCAELRLLEFGKQLHGNCIKYGLGSSIAVDTSIVSMYAKCGHLEDANRVFKSMQSQNEITFTALISGYAQIGKGKEWMGFCDKMIAGGMKPDFVISVCRTLLAACTMYGDIELAEAAAKALFELQPHNAALYATLSNIYAAAGKWEDVASVRKYMKSGGVHKKPACTRIEINA